MSKIWLVQIQDYEPDIWNFPEEFSTRKKAIEWGIKEAKSEGSRCFWLGQKEEYKPDFCIDTFLEKIQEDAYEEVGEVADDYLNDVNQDEKDTLKKSMLQLFSDWTKRFCKTHSFYKVTDTQCVIVENFKIGG